MPRNRPWEYTETSSVVGTGEWVFIPHEIQANAYGKVIYELVIVDGMGRVEVSIASKEDIEAENDNVVQTIWEGSGIPTSGNVETTVNAVSEVINAFRMVVVSGTCTINVRIV